jgi:hypothetical protein
MRILQTCEFDNKPVPRQRCDRPPTARDLAPSLHLFGNSRDGAARLQQRQLLRAGSSAGTLLERPPANSARPTNSSFTSTFERAWARISYEHHRSHASSGTSTIPGRTTARQQCAAALTSNTELHKPRTRRGNLATKHEAWGLPEIRFN